MHVNTAQDSHTAVSICIFLVLLRWRTYNYMISAEEPESVLWEGVVKATAIFI